MTPEYGTLLPDVMRDASKNLVAAPRVFHEAREVLGDTLLFQVKFTHDLYRKFIRTFDSVEDNKIYFTSSLEDERVRELQRKIEANTIILKRRVAVSLSFQDMFDLQNVFDEFGVFNNRRNPEGIGRYNDLKKEMKKAFDKASDPKWASVRKVFKSVGAALSQRGEL